MNLAIPDMDLDLFINNEEESKMLSQILFSDEKLYFDPDNNSTLKFEGVLLPHNKITIGVLEYSGHLAIKSQNSKNYNIFLPLEGDSKIFLNREIFSLNKNEALICSPFDDIEINIPKKFKFYLISIPEESILKTVANLTKVRRNDKIIFDKLMSTNKESIIEAWWGNIFHFVDNKHKYRNFYGSNSMIIEYENYLLKSLLLTHANNYSESLLMNYRL